MKEQILIKNLSSELKPFSAAASLTNFLSKWSGFTLMIVILSYLLLPGRADLVIKMESLRFHIENILWLVAAVTSGMAFYYSAFPQKVKNNFWLPTVFIFSILLLLVFSQFHFSGLSEEIQNEMSLWRGRCGFIILAVSMIHATFMGMWAKKFAPRDGGLTGFWAALSASSIGCLFMQIVCIHENTMHLLLWHFLPLTLICFAGQKLGQRFLRW